MNPQVTDLSQLRQWLLDDDSFLIFQFTRKKKRILSLLTALTYFPDTVVSNRAIWYTGLAAKIINEHDPEFVRNYLLRLFWLVNDESGGIGWHSPELIGEILFHCPNFAQFIPMLISLLDLEQEDAPRFQEGTLKAIARTMQNSQNLAYLKQLNTIYALKNEQARCALESLFPGANIESNP